MFCKKCGKEVDNDSLFCSFCGAELKNSNESKEDNAIITETDKKYVERPKKDNGDKIFLIIFLSVVAFLIIVALIAFSKDSNDGETSTSYNSQKYNSVQLSDIHQKEEKASFCTVLTAHSCTFRLCLKCSATEKLKN